MLTSAQSVIDNFANKRVNTANTVAAVDGIMEYGRAKNKALK